MIQLLSDIWTGIIEILKLFWSLIKTALPVSEIVITIIVVLIMGGIMWFIFWKTKYRIAKSKKKKDTSNSK